MHFLGSKEYVIPESVKGGKWYVYFLCYPDGRVFYVGKGTGNRVDAHEANCRRILRLNRLTYLEHKDKVMIDIWDNGGEVLKRIVYRTDNEQDAFTVEAHLIMHFGLHKLTNKTYGHRTRKRPRRQ